MIKRKIVETVEEYDANGKLVRKTTTETEEDDTAEYQPYTYPVYPYPTYPLQPSILPNQPIEITCTKPCTKPFEITWSNTSGSKETI